MFESNNKSGIKSCVVKLLPLSDEDKKFILRLDSEKLRHNNEYFLLVKKVNEFRRHYIAAPLINRSMVKESFRNELQECCDNLKDALMEKKISKKNDAKTTIDK